MKLEWHEDGKGFEALRAEWNPLLQRSATDVPFLTWEWQQAWWDAFGRGRKLRLLALRNDSGQLSAILPLFAQDTLMDASAAMQEIDIERFAPATKRERQRTLHLVGGTEVSDYLDIIAPAELHRAAWAAFLDALASQDDWQVLDLHCLPAASPTLIVADELARAHGWDVQQGREDVCPVVELPGSWEEYLATKLNKKQRHELRRKMRRAEQEARVEWHWVEAADRLDEELGVFFELHKASAADKNEFMDADMQSFFHTVARAALDRGWLRLSVLRFNGQPVASYLCFDFRGDILLYNSGFDLSAYADLSPGIVLVGYMIQDAIQRGRRRFDFLRGDERYKYEFGPLETEVRRLWIRRRVTGP